MTPCRMLEYPGWWMYTLTVRLTKILPRTMFLSEIMLARQPLSIIFGWNPYGWVEFVSLSGMNRTMARSYMSELTS